MAREFPRFQPRGAVVPGPIASSAPVFNELARTFQKIQGAAGKEALLGAAAEAKVTGSLAGIQPGFKPTRGGGFAQRAFNEAALKSNRYVLGATIGTGVDGILKDSEKNLDGHKSLEQFNVGLGAFSENLLAEVPRENLAFAKNVLMHQGRVAAQKLNKQVEAQSHRELFFEFNEVYNVNERMASNAARSGDVSGAQGYAGIIRKQVEDGINAGWLSGAQAAKYVQKADNEVHIQDALFQYESSLRDKKGPEFVESFRKSKKWDKIFSQTEKTTVLSKMQKLKRAQLAKEGADKASIGQLEKEILFRAGFGVSPTAEHLARIQAFDPNKFPGFERKLQFAQKKGAIVESAEDLDIFRLKSKIATLNSSPTEKELTGIDAVEQLQLRKGAANILQGKLDKLIEDPAAATKQSSIYKASTKRMEEDVSSGIPFSPETINQRVVDNDDVLLNLQRNKGLDEDQLRLLSNEESANAVITIKEAGFEKGLTLLGQMQDRYGKNFISVQRGLVTQGLPMMMHLAIGLQNIPKSEPFLGEVKAAFENTPKDLSTAIASQGFKRSDFVNAFASNTQVSSFFNSLNSYNSDNLSQQVELEGAMTAVAEQLVSDRKATDPEDGMQQAFTVLIGNRYASIDDEKRIPSDISPESVEVMLAIKSEELKTFPFKLLGTANAQLGEDFRRETDFRDAISKGHWVTNPDEQGMSFVDVTGRPVKGIDGKVFGFSFDSLSAPEFTEATLPAFKKQQLKRFADESLSSLASEFLLNPFAVEFTVAQKLREKSERKQKAESAKKRATQLDRLFLNEK